MARPLKVIDENLLKKLCQIMCTTEEMAHILGVSPDTLERRFAGAIKEWKSQGKMTLRRWQWQACEKGNPALLIWMGKQHLGQVDRQEQQITQASININISKDDADL